MRYALAALVVNGLTVAAANAYTAAGDRNFPATLVLPQIAPSDAFWITPSTQPTMYGQQTSVTGTYSKLITERLGIQIEGGFVRRGSFNGAQNLDIQIQYEAILDRDHEFLMSFQVDQEIGGVG
ncbi:MAG: hypothetical protein ACJ8AW_03660, partial [Rhodopila sp.]